MVLYGSYSRLNQRNRISVFVHQRKYRKETGECKDHWKECEGTVQKKKIPLYKKQNTNNNKRHFSKMKKNSSSLSTDKSGQVSEQD